MFEKLLDKLCMPLFRTITVADTQAEITAIVKSKKSWFTGIIYLVGLEFSYRNTYAGIQQIRSAREDLKAKRIKRAQIRIQIKKGEVKLFRAKKRISTYQLVTQKEVYKTRKKSKRVGKHAEGVR